MRPLLKKSRLDKEVYKNYCHVSNVPLTLIFLEKVVPNRLDEHLLKDSLQSAYRKTLRKQHFSSLITTSWKLWIINRPL